jgi:SAM-dependent methyltransferase
MIPDPEKVRLWEARAQAYDRLCRRWEIFSLLSIRLIDMLPADLRGTVLDIGAGSGLTSELLLARRPHCDAVLIEPSPAMLDIARVRLAGRRAQFLVMGLDQAVGRDLRAVAALSSAAFQFLDLEPAFGALAPVLPRGGHFAFNLWYHHWEETASGAGMNGWLPIVQAACREAHLPPVDPAVPSAPPKTRAELTRACREQGFELLSEHRDEDRAAVLCGVEFQAMSADWPAKGLTKERRQALLQRMQELADSATETVVSTRFLLRKAA